MASNEGGEAERKRNRGGEGMESGGRGRRHSPLYFMAKLFWQKNNSISASVQVIVRVLSRYARSGFLGKKWRVFTFGQIRNRTAIKSNPIFRDLRAKRFSIPLARFDLVTERNEINEDRTETETKRSTRFREIG